MLCTRCIKEDEARTDIGGLDHAHVVPAIANTAYALFCEIPDKTRDVCLLRRRAPARDDSGELGRDLNKLILEQGEAELRCGYVNDKHVISNESLYLERLAVDDETTIKLVLQKIKFVLGLFRSLDYMSSTVSTVHHVIATRATQKKNLRLATW